MKLRRVVVGIVIALLAVPIILVLWIALLLSGKGDEYVVRAADIGSHQFEARALFVATDADMVGTSYADGILHPIQDAYDAVSRIDADTQAVHTSASAITNSVTAWPGTLDLSPDAQHAYVIESRGPAPEAVERVKNVHKDLRMGRSLTTLQLGDGSLIVVRQDDIAIDPTSVHAAPNGEWLIIAARDAAFPISFAILDRGVPIEIRHPQVRLPSVPVPPKAATDVESFDGVSYARIAPNGRTVALHIQSTYLVLGEILFDADGRPSDIRLGEVTQPAKFMSVGRWSADGRFYIVSDTQWGPTPGDSFVAGAGRLVSIAVDGLSSKVISTATVSLGSEGMEMSPDGTLFVAVNMERTFTPNTFPFNFIPRRDRASLSLVSFDIQSGELRSVDGPVAFEGVLPEDAVFDRNARMLAVAVFNEDSDRPTHGWIELFAIDRSEKSPRIVPTGKRIRTPRGAHDLAVVY